MALAAQPEANERFANTERPPAEVVSGAAYMFPLVSVVVPGEACLDRGPGHKMTSFGHGNSDAACVPPRTSKKEALTQFPLCSALARQHCRGNTFLAMANVLDVDGRPVSYSRVVTGVVGATGRGSGWQSAE